ncbi:MAG TPA: DUF6230 family protein [Rugosimonospora sp.]|nr:DUF6230 family protein [Rugosimonospora sp.]
MTGSGQGRVRWRRFAAMMLASAAAGATLVVLTAQGALAAQFSISGMPFTVTATQLSGTGFEQFATLDSMIPNSPNAGNTGGQLVLVVSAIGKADLTGLCQSIDLGGTFLKLTAGGSGSPVHAETMVVDSSELSGNASFTNIQIGQDSSTLDAVKKVTGQSVTGFPGVLGQQADTVTINNLRQTNYATTAATFTLPNLHMAFTSTGC